MRRNVLLVDDDRTTHELVTFSLEQAGYVVRIIRDGFDALNELQTRHFDIVLLDISLPHLSGFTLLQKLRANPKTADIPVVMLSASHDSKDIQKSQRLGAADYVIKPAQREDLLKRLERILGGKPKFYEIKFNDGDKFSMGHVESTLALRSISLNGVIFDSPLELTQGAEGLSFHFALFTHLGIDPKKCKLLDCHRNPKGGWTCFVSFVDLSGTAQQKIRDWLMTRTFEMMNRTG